jgi:EAL domain-containing protein (putative c-di-GMP-specific phosphodiesterase class I)
VANICASGRDEAIVRSTIDLARHLGLRVVAEGIETPEVGQRLLDVGCDVAQGYLLCRPMPPEQLTAWLRTALIGGQAPLAQAS